MASFFHPGLFVKECNIGKGIFTDKPIKKGETVIDFSGGPGKYLNTWDAYSQYEAKGFHFIIQVDDDRYLVAVDGPETGDYINHSCDPTCGVKGSVAFAARRDIEPGEEINFDYCMAESFYYYRLKCECRTKTCRGQVTGSDWKRPELQQRYRGFFSDYIQKKIDRPWIVKMGLEITEPIGRFVEKTGDQLQKSVQPLRARLGLWRRRFRP